MHYVNIEEIPRLTKGMGDSSGVYIHYSTKAQQKIVGMISLHVQTNLPPLSRSYQDVTCTLKEKKVFKIKPKKTNNRAKIFLTTVWIISNSLLRFQLS